jgi:hypothetical protein
MVNTFIKRNSVTGDALAPLAGGGDQAVFVLAGEAAVFQ